ncbi:phosphopentomutase [Alicyclobacillus fastidiosus]|uniref:Phosphopentomutase n=1 Tax=Alicyclobacillus fastidiosus TaxID=392011 RepID=A0ABY6ZES9_9BACL|nr:phosphopentomutase [Alicyclobacillus fastidiosus]WAH41230.1 phosphopentomutase [Alicyclobacillus fastidiosus]GMA62819.1 phosphopentomutase [Alicyclobacillus fastidiosus]
MKRAVVLVIDGFGAGAMQDVSEVRPQDLHADTMKHVLEATGVKLPFLAKFGLGTILNDPALLQVDDPIASYGRCNLYHPGADSYAGHNEIMGARPLHPKMQFIRELASEIEEQLTLRGWTVSYPVRGTKVMLVNDQILIADNMENDPGQIINVTGALDVTPFSDILAVGQVVRRIAKTSRVIALGGTGVSVRDVIDHVVIEPLRSGVDTGRLNIYNEDYQVRHLGYGIDPDTQIHSILRRSGKTVYLYGKMADVITGDVNERNPMVDSQGVIDLIVHRLENMRGEGLVCATVQETDLAGHEQDPQKFARVLNIVDRGAEAIFGALEDGDLFIITADHGNDPCIGSSQHTRETTPLLVHRKGDASYRLGVRETLADIAATVSQFFDVPAPEFGVSCFADTSYPRNSQS